MRHLLILFHREGRDVSCTLHYTFPRLISKLAMKRYSRPPNTLAFCMRVLNDDIQRALA